MRSWDTDFEAPEVSIPVESRPEMDSCVGDEQSVAIQRESDGLYVHCLPVAFDGKIAAVIELVRDGMLDGEGLDSAEGFIGLYRNYLSLLEYSERDMLTGLLNRRTFDEQLGKILASLRGVDEPGLPDNTDRRETAEESEAHWLAVIDVDHFKRVNEEFGHLYGDEVLILLSNLMRESFRHRDKLFRFGGEEFVAVLKPARRADVTRALERFRERIARQTFPQVGQVTVSIGFAPIQLGETIAEVLGKADEALYHAKSSGRNQVCSFDDLPPSGSLPRAAPPG